MTVSYTLEKKLPLIEPRRGSTLTLQDDLQEESATTKPALASGTTSLVPLVRSGLQDLKAMPVLPETLVLPVLLELRVTLALLALRVAWVLLVNVALQGLLA
tara:strand:- start:2690 stop:2995 length:306 start_codon:yes stop_codon:yes gene_type:complete